MRGNGNKAFFKGVAAAVIGAFLINWVGNKMRTNKQPGA